MIVINTCTVTAAAASDSRQKIRQAARTDAAQVIVTGCYASLNLQETAAFPRVTQVIDNRSKDNLVPMVLTFHNPHSSILSCGASLSRVGACAHARLLKSRMAAITTAPTASLCLPVEQVEAAQSRPYCWISGQHWKGAARRLCSPESTWASWGN